MTGPAIRGEDSVRVREVQCKSLLNRSGITDYAVNCYSGCQHGCRYCYGRFATRFNHPGEEWGSFVDAKVNAPEVLEREARRKRTGTVFVSSVCDGWQPAEAEYGLTRRCLQILLRHGFPLHILTKSSLIRRDFDILTRRPCVELGVTLTTMDEDLRRLVEPRASPTHERTAVLREAKLRSVTTYAFLGPFLPGVTDSEENLRSLLAAIKEAGVDYFYLDRLNPRYGVWPSLRSLLGERFPDRLDECKAVLFNRQRRAQYSCELLGKVERLATKQGLAGRMLPCF